MVFLGPSRRRTMNDTAISTRAFEDPEGSVTGLLRGVKQGNAEAAGKLYERYFHQLAQVAKSKFRGIGRSVADEEDIASTVLETLCRNAAKGKYPDLCDRQGLWLMLLAITSHKVSDEKRHHFLLKRGGGKVRTMTDLIADFSRSIEAELAEGPSQDSMVSFVDSFQHLVQKIHDPLNRRIAVLKLQGLSNREIAKQLNILARSVDRKVQLIRAVWSSAVEDYLTD